MRINLKQLIQILIIASFFSGIAYAQENDIRFKQLTIEDGLSQITALSIIQDKHGFIWFGTQDGLNRYDGYEFKVFRHEAGNKNSLSNNYIWSVYEDTDGIIWIGTFGGGLNRFDPTTESFQHFKHDENNENTISSNDVFGITEYPEGILWLRTGNGVSKFDSRTNNVTRYLTEHEIKGKSLFISSFTIESQNIIWAGTHAGLTKLDVASGEHEYLLSAHGNSEFVFGNIFSLNIKNDDLYICCDSGLIKIDLKSSFAERIVSPPSQGNRVVPIRSLLIDGNFFWIGTNNGLYLYNDSSETRKHFSNNPNKPNSLTHNTVTTLFKSKEGIIWIGTYGGVNKIEKLRGDFELVQYDPTEKNTLSNKSIGPVLEDKNGIVWIGTPAGLNAYNRTTKENLIFKHIPVNKRSLSSDYILSLYQDKNGNIWVGTRNGGVKKFNYSNKADLKNISFERVNLGSAELNNSRVHSLLEDSYGSVWIGTGGSGLVRYSPVTGETKLYAHKPDGTGLSHNYAYYLFEDSKNNFWIGTASGGLNLFDREKEEFLYIRTEEDNLSSLSNNIVLSIFEDRNNTLWIGTSGGLNKLNSKLEANLFKKIKDSSLAISFTRYGNKEGLPNEVIYGILEDNKGSLWLSTNNGLVKFNLLSTNPVVKIYDVRDGLQSNEFNQNSFYKNRVGEMYFGGINGLNIFHPDSLRINNNIPSVCFTDFKIFNESIQIRKNPGDDHFSLDKQIHLTDKLELSFDQNVITFEFAALNFIATEKNQYAYMMEGFDKDWIITGNKREATYTNLDPGEYTFRVKASNNDGIWNEQGAAIKLSISPPPWLSWYAYIFYAFIFIGMLLLYVRFRVNAATRELETQAKIERAKIEEREDVRRKSSADFHDEAGNKLTKITLFTELLKNVVDDNPSAKEYVHKIEENTKEISSGMRDFIWVLDPSKDSLYDTISRLKDFGNSMFDYTNTRFTVNGLTDDMNDTALSMEARRALMLICKEALNNCLKYSCAKNVEINIAIENKFLELIIKDDGKGFDLKEKSDGYGLNNMRERARQINCSIEIFSDAGRGTKIKLKGNIPQMGN